MSNVIPLRLEKEPCEIVHRMTFELVPRDTLAKIFYTAIAVAWASDNGGYKSNNEDSEEKMDVLRRVIGEASQYAVPVNLKTGIPV